MFVCKGWYNKFKINTVSTDKKDFRFLASQQEESFNLSMWSKGGGEEKGGSVQLKEGGRHPLPYSIEKYYLVFDTTNSVMFIIMFFYLLTSEVAC